MKLKKSIICLCLISLIIFPMVTFGVSAENNQSTYTENEQLHGKKIALKVGSTYEKAIQKDFPDSEIVYIDSVSDQIQALNSGKIDAYCTDYPVAAIACATNNKITFIKTPIAKEDYAFVLNKTNTELQQKVNEALAELKADGTTDKLYDKWLNNPNDSNVVEHDKNASTANGILRVATEGTNDGLLFMKNGVAAGFEAELVTKIAEKLNMGVEFTTMPFSSVIPSVTSGKFDMGVSCITITEERKENVLFSDVVHSGGIVFVVKNYDTAETEDTSFLTSIKDSFRRTFITESRWKSILSGLLVTFILSVCSTAIGTAVGFVFSFPLRSKNKYIKNLCKAINAVIDGTPVVVILMILYYLIFEKSNAPAIIVGIIGISLCFAKDVSQMIDTGVATVPIGQWEAAEALGYKRLKTFNKIIFPQAANSMFNQYKGGIVSLVKETAIVGYITIQDLTRVSDIIRGRTYESFFPLITTAVIYFLLARIILAVMKIAGNKLNPQKRRNILKGVKR